MTLRQGELETAVEIRAALDAGEVTATEVVERALRRAEAWQPHINAFSQLWADESVEEARERAAAVRSERRSGERSRLRSVPLAVKDLYDVAGRPTTGCSAAYGGNVATSDAAVITSMREAGVIMVGKTNQHELAAGGTNLASACGRTGNPWDPQRMTGGSSGGSAAAVAAGITPVALGSDTGGSIRIPASMCGTFGLKPTTGKLSTEGMMSLAPSMDCPGPIAATVEDLELLYRAMGGTAAAERPDADGLAEGRVAIPDGFFAEAVHPDVLRAVGDVAEVLEANGVEIEPIEGHGIEDARQVWMVVCTPEFAAAHPLALERKALLHPQVASWLDLGIATTPEARTTAARRRQEIARWFEQKLEGFDALLIPTTPYPAPRADQGTVDLGAAGAVDVNLVGPGWLTCSVNLANLPALNLPAGRSPDGLPIGVTLVGKKDAEETLLRLGRLWEQATAYRPRLPAPSAG